MDRSGPARRNTGVAATDDPDRRLVQQARAGSTDAAAVLVDRHWHACWKVARGILGDAAAAEDVVQEALAAALTGIGRFDPDRGTFAGWLHRITVNRALGEVRRTRRSPVVDGSILPDRVAAGADLRGGFLDAVADLRPLHRAVVVLRFGLDLGPAEIADVLEIPVGTVNSRLARALATLRQTMEDPRVH